MAYNRRNYLIRIVDVQHITLEHTAKGVNQEWLFNNVIAPTYHISRRTYYNWLSTPAKQDLKKIEARPKQMQLF